MVSKYLLLAVIFSGLVTWIPRMIPFILVKYKGLPAIVERLSRRRKIDGRWKGLSNSKRKSLYLTERCWILDFGRARFRIDRESSIKKKGFELKVVKQLKPFLSENFFYVKPWLWPKGRGYTILVILFENQIQTTSASPYRIYVTDFVSSIYNLKAVLWATCG